MKNENSAFRSSTEPLLDLAALRADTPGCEAVIHFNNAGCGLMARPVLRTMVDHLRLEAGIGGYEAAAARAAEVAGFYAALAELLGTRPDKEVEWCLRLSPHYYNTEDEVDAVAGAVAELAGGAR
ncbi:hypothetical protein ACH4E7_12645 [Kitasatospora sp. NPDC018058]|uniref:hypothetical protein n=1 Tax=Kitasatospora sp. NPDC018058 TaxID=3364025 RepID=UPI0037BEB1E8